MDLNHPTSRDQSARYPNQSTQVDEDLERRNPRSRPSRYNDAESASSSSHGRTPSKYTRSGSVQTQQGGHYQVHRGDLRDHLNAVFRARSRVPRNTETLRDPHADDQGANTYNNPPTAPIATTGINVPANLAAVVASPAVVAAPAPAAGGIDQSMLLQALKMLEQQRKPIYKLHGTSPFTTEVRQAQLPKGFRLSESLKYKGTSNPIDYLEKFNTIMEVD